MRYILIAIFSIFVQVAAFASDGSVPVIVFRGGSQTGSDILYTKSTNILAPDVCFDFVATSGDRLPSHYQLSGGSYVYAPPTPPPPPPPPMDMQGFQLALWSDGAVPVAARLQLAGFFPLLDKNISNIPVMQSGWAALVSVAGVTGGWLTSSIQTEVLRLAALYRVPLTP